jgi:ankyrin repeat protein
MGLVSLRCCWSPARCADNLKRRMDAIFQAVLNGPKDVARVLRSMPAAVEIRAPRDLLVESIPHWMYIGDTSLHLAAAALRADVADLLLASGADPNAVNRRGATPLHYACDPRPRSGGTWHPSRQAALIELLVKRGADVDRPDRGGATPLHRAVRARSASATAALLTLGARTDRRLKKSGASPLHLAVQPTGAGGTAGTIEAQLAIIALLIQHGADPDARNGSGWTPRQRATHPRVIEALAVGRRVARRRFRTRKAGPDAR